MFPTTQAGEISCRPNVMYYTSVAEAEMRRPRNALGKRVDLFAHLYYQVTRDLRSYAKTLQPSDRRWFGYLIRGFLRQFRDWDNSDLSGYFAIIHAKPVSRYVTLAGYAFLHIAYDLPRTIADSLVHPQVGPASLTDLNRRRLAYVAVSPRFPDIIVDFLEDRWLVRHFGESKFGRAVIEQIAYWAIALRTVAWVHAEILRDGPARRRAMEQQILECLHRSARIATARGMKGIPSFHTMDLKAVTPMLFAWPLSDQSEIVVTIASAAVAAASLAYQSYRQRRTRRSPSMPESLGSALERELRRLTGVIEEAMVKGEPGVILPRVQTQAPIAAYADEVDENGREVLRRIELFGSVLLEDVSRALLGLQYGSVETSP
jgi:hypothetical protein